MEGVRLLSQGWEKEAQALGEWCMRNPSPLTAAATLHTKVVVTTGDQWPQEPVKLVPYLSISEAKLNSASAPSLPPRCCVPQGCDGEEP